MFILCAPSEKAIAEDARIAKNQKRIAMVLSLSAVTMVGEIIVGQWAGSVALIADGWHMGSHVGALLISLLAYWLARHSKILANLSFGGGKLLPLGGFSSAIVLGVLAVMIFVESVERLASPTQIHYGEAIAVAAFGLVVNILSAVLLHTSDEHDHAHPHHDHDHGHHHHVHDHNIRSAFLHVIADAVTSVLAILALSLGWKWGWNFLDPIIGVIGALVILSWAVQLCRDTGFELLDGDLRGLNWPKLESRLVALDVKIVDFHAWRIAPKASSCTLIVESKVLRGSQFYRLILEREFGLTHSVIEERTRPD